MKIFALDIGDQWTGTAISDELCLVARPYQTIETTKLESFLAQLLAKEPISKVIVGYPRTMRGTESDQTKKTRVHKETLEKLFQTITWILWDERLSSKQAEALKHAKTKEEKIQAHSIAAAFILSSYLEYARL